MVRETQCHDGSVKSLCRGRRFPPKIISHAVWLYHQCTLSPRDIEDLLAEGGVTLSCEEFRFWCRKFGPARARNLCSRQGRLGDAWQVDEAFIRICGERRYRWRAVVHDLAVVDTLVRRRRHARPARRFFRKLLKGHGRPPWQLVTDRPGSHAATAGTSACCLFIEPGRTRTTGPKRPTSASGSATSSR